MEFQLLLLLLTMAVEQCRAYVPGEVFDRFFTIWLPSQEFSADLSEMRLQSVVKQGILLKNYWALTHPSQPNYVASVGGDYFGLNHNDAVTIPGNISTVVDLLDTRAIGWKAYLEEVPIQESPTIACSGLSDTGKIYRRDRNPFESYESVRLNSTRIAQIQGFEDFFADLDANQLPQFAHFSPGFDTNESKSDRSAQTAHWLDTFLIPLLDNKHFMNNTLLLLTFDQSAIADEPNQVMGLLLGDAIPEEEKGTTDPRFYSPYSVLSTIENNWNLPCLGRYDVGANVFEFVTHTTGYKNHMPSNMKTVNNSLSYFGFLNNETSHFKAIPPPNVKLIGAGRQGVAPSIETVWGPRVDDPSPYEGTNRANDGGPESANAVIYHDQGPAPPKYAVLSGRKA